MTTQYDSATHASLANDAGSTSFLCPSCGKQTIYRSRKSRQTVVKYTCPECGFTGPN